MLKKQVEDGIFKKYDKWIIIEGAADNNGSTSWCNEFPERYIKLGRSIDGTHEYLKSLCNGISIFHVHLVPEEFPDDNKWHSKDEMVNSIMPYLSGYRECFLWEVDVDEFWDIDNIKMSEFQLVENKAKAASFLCDYFIGDDRIQHRQLVVKGGWGEGNTLRYNRLWLWQEGDKFISHEPPILTGQTNANTLQLPYRFKHYSYTDHDIVSFKNQWYGGHEGILQNWVNINWLTPKSNFPLPISEFLPDKKWDDGNTLIHWVDKASFVLYIQWFKSENNDRNEEVVRAIKKNASNVNITKIYVFAEGEFTETIDKVEIIDLGRRMTYLDCFMHMKLCDVHDSYYIIANSDIVIPEETTNKLQYQDVTLNNSFLALSRYEYENGKISYIGHDKCSWSQDVWIFKKDDISLEQFSRSNFYLGVCSCDNIIARIAHDAGMRVINPSVYLKTIHLHESRYRTYSGNSGYYGQIAFIKATDNFIDNGELSLSHSVWEKPIYI